MGPSPSAGRPRSRRVELTASDGLVLEFLAEHRFARAGQVARLLGVSPRTASARCNRLAEADFLTRDRPWSGQPDHYQIKRQGLAAIGSELRAPKPDLSAYEHDIGMAWIWLAARGGAFGELSELTSERQLRSRDARTRLEETPAIGRGERLGVRIPGDGPGGGERLHYPDLLLRTATGHRVAVELELTAKSHRRVDQIIGAYAGERRIDAVLYLVDDGRQFRSVRAAARKHGVSDLVHVQRVRFTEPAGFPARSRAAERRGERSRDAEASR